MKAVHAAALAVTLFALCATGVAAANGESTEPASYTATPLVHTAPAPKPAGRIVNVGTTTITVNLQGCTRVTCRSALRARVRAACKYADHVKVIGYTTAGTETVTWDCDQ